MVGIQIRPEPAMSGAFAAGVTFAFYAIPDFIRSRTLRFFGKTILLATSSRQLLSVEGDHWKDSMTELQSLIDDADTDTLNAVAGVAAAAGVAGTVAIVGGEKMVFYRAEKKRAQGKRLPHTKQALALAALTGGLLYALETAEIS